MRKVYILYFLICCSVANAQSVKAAKCIMEMLDSINNIKTVRFKVKAVERIENGYVAAASESKIQVKPRKLYFNNPAKKLEILYVQGKNDNKALIKPHVFPYISLQLSPTNNLMRRNQHYTINELGFDFIGRAIALALSKDKDNMLDRLSYYGIHEKNGEKCHLVIYESSAFDYFTYEVGKKETITSIAAKFNVNDYLLRNKNNLHNDYSYLKEGSTLTVPHFYCKRAVLYIDEKTMIPVSVTIYDDVSLFENYDFYNIIINKPIDEIEFTRDYKDYHF